MGRRQSGYKGDVFMTYQEEYKRWAAADLQDFDLNRELREIAGDDEAIRDRFAVALTFGTAGWERGRTA